MEADGPPDVKFAIQADEIFLQELTFERFGSVPKEMDPGNVPLELSFGLGVGRYSPVRVLSELTLSVTQEDLLEVAITYRASFDLVKSEAEDDDSDLDALWRHFAAFSLPTIIYPYMRETVSSLSTKAGLPALHLPVVNFRKVFDPDEIEFGEAEELD